MTNLTPAAGRPAADLFPASPARSVGWGAAIDQRTLEHERLEHRARGTDATAQLLRCFPRWSGVLEQLTARALERLARNEPVNPNDPDDDAGLHWSIVTSPASLVDERLRRAHGRLPIALEDPAVWAYALDQRRALAARLGFDERHADDLSRWVLANPGGFDQTDLRCWRIGSESWLALAGEQLEPVAKVDRPVGVFVVAAMRASDGWQLVQVLALDTIRSRLSICAGSVDGVRASGYGWGRVRDRDF